MGNKKFIGILAAAVLAFGGNLFVGQIAQAAPNDIIDIPDANFRACLNGLLGQTPPEADITEAQAASFTGTLKCDGEGITDTTGFKYFSNPGTVMMQGNAFESIEFAEHMPNLLQVTLNVNPELKSITMPLNATKLSSFMANNTGLESFYIPDGAVLSSLW